MTPSNVPPLVSTDWLQSNLAAPDIVILDASFFLPNQNRDAASEFAQGHVPGARFFDIDEVADHQSSLPHMLPTPAQFAAAVGAMGIGNDSHVIAYDSNSFMASARLWWTFRVFGHDRISVLDGGFARWKAESRRVTADVAAPVSKTFRTTSRPELVKHLTDLLNCIGKPDTQVLDARSPGRYAGTEPEPRAGLRSGHIPGSHNLFFKDLLDSETGCMKPREALSALFSNAGIDATRPVITSCGTGVTAAVLALGLFRLGNTETAVYDGSWTEWGGRTDTPVATS